MTLHEQYQVLLNDFCLKHKEELSRLPKFKDEGDSFDFTPSYSQRMNSEFDKSTFPENNPLIQQFVDLVYNLFWGKEDVITVKLNGHFNLYDGKTLKEINELKPDLYHHLFSRDFLKEALNNHLIYDLVGVAILEGKDHFPQLTNSNRPNIIGGLIDLWESSRCPFCDKAMTFEYNHIEKIFTSRSIKTNEQPCIHTQLNGNNIYSFIIDTPSKKLVFMNDIREVFNVDREDEYTVSLNSILGKKRECEVYAENNMAYFFVSNTSPSIYQNEKQIVIDPLNVKFKRDKKNGEFVIPDDYIDRGNICTDLWAVCMADYDDFLKRCKENEIDLDHFDIVVVDVNTTQVHVDYNFLNYLIEIKNK